MAVPFMALFGLAGKVVDHFASAKKRKDERKDRIEDAKVAKVERDDASAADWDRLMAEGSQSSWKDEYWTIVLSIPAVLAFVPGASEYVQQGFEVLAGMPEWYRYALGIAIAAAFGFRQVAKMVGRGK